MPFRYALILVKNLTLTLYFEYHAKQPTLCLRIHLKYCVKLYCTESVCLVASKYLTTNYLIAMPSKLRHNKSTKQCKLSRIVRRS